MTPVARRALISVSLLLAASYTGFILESERERLQIPRSAARVTLGGFEPIAANVLWMRAGDLLENDRFTEAIAVGRVLTRLQPRIPEGWDIIAWGLAWENADYGTPGAQWELVREALRLIREGLEYNPDSELLLMSLGLLYLERISKRPDLRPIAERALRGPPEALALAAFQARYRIDPGPIRAGLIRESALLLARRLEEAGEIEAAIEAYGTALAAIREIQPSIDDPAAAGIVRREIEAVSARIRDLMER